MSKKCTPLWREAHFQVKMYKTLHVRTADVARRTFPSQNVQNTSALEHFWKLRCSKSVRRCGAKHISKSKVQKMKGSERFWTFRCRFAWQAQGIVHLVKSEQDVRLLWPVSKTMAGVGHMRRIWQDAFRVAGAMQETCSSELLGVQGADFLRGVALWSIKSSGLLR